MQNAVPKHYLWAIGEGLKACRPGELIAGRYLLKRDRILVDTQPEQLPEMPEDIPGYVVPYLRLFPYRLHIPQLYGLIPRSAGRLSGDIWLLEKGPIAKNGESPIVELTQVWKNASPMRQLNWLWQIAQLWQPCSSQGVASTLLNPQLLRVEGPLVRVLELQPDNKAPSLSQLGQLWQSWVSEAHPTIASFLKQICQQMTNGQLRHADQLIGQLDKALAICGKAQDRIVQIATGTDTGPSRSHNEDACYPVGGSLLKVAPGPDAVAIVCDGIGGQEGGEVASELAITTLRDRVQQMALQLGNWEPSSVISKLERAACAANDAISGRNDIEHRQGRQRMGTTLVMGLAHAHEVYITHLGDSRAYWITRQGCYQVTLDDDVASREVRLGYAIYRDALQQVAAGALVQALGITSSATLHPTVQRFPVDEDCVFLLCSDGLSDNDRLEECWEAELLPILEGRIDPARARDRLIAVANTRNGHDNVTVAVIHCQAIAKAETLAATELSVLPLELPPSAGDTAIPREDNVDPNGEDTSSSKIKTIFIPPIRNNPLPQLLGILLLLLGGGLLSYLLIPAFSEWVDRQIQSYRTETEAIESTHSPSVSPSPNLPPPSPLDEGSLVEVIKRSGDRPATPQNDPLELANEPGKLPVKGLIPSGTILQVVTKETVEDNSWLKVKVCWMPPPATPKPQKPRVRKDFQVLPKRDSKASPSPSPTATANGTPAASEVVTPRLLQPGETGWILESEVLTRMNPNLPQQIECSAAELPNQ